MQGYTPCCVVKSVEENDSELDTALHFLGVRKLLIVNGLRRGEVRRDERLRGRRREIRFTRNGSTDWVLCQHYLVICNSNARSGMGRMRTLDSNGISGFCCRGIGLFFVWEKGLAYRLW